MLGPEIDCYLGTSVSGDAVLDHVSTWTRFDRVTVGRFVVLSVHPALERGRVEQRVSRIAGVLRVKRWNGVPADMKVPPDFISSPRLLKRFPVSPWLSSRLVGIVASKDQQKRKGLLASSTEDCRSYDHVHQYSPC